MYPQRKSKNCLSSWALNCAPDVNVSVKVIDYVEKYKDVLIKDELSLDALKHEIGDVVNRINAEHPKMKRMKCTATPLGRDCTIRIEAHVISGGCPDTVFFLDICKVRSIYQFSEKANMLEQKGGENG